MRAGRMQHPLFFRGATEVAKGRGCRKASAGGRKREGLPESVGWWAGREKLADPPRKKKVWWLRMSRRRHADDTRVRVRGAGDDAMGAAWGSERCLGLLYPSTAWRGKRLREPEPPHPNKVAKTTVADFIASIGRTLLFALQRRVEAVAYFRRVHEPCGDFVFGLRLEKRNETQTLVTATADAAPIRALALVVHSQDTMRLAHHLDQIAGHCACACAPSALPR